MGVYNNQQYRNINTIEYTVRTTIVKTGLKSFLYIMPRSEPGGGGGGGVLAI